MKPIGLEHETCYTEGINVYLCTTPRPLTHVWGNCVPLAWAQLHRKPGAFSAPWPSVAAHPCPHLRSLPEAAHHHHPCTIRLYILWHGAHALRLSVPVCALTESWAPLNALFARTENWRSLVAPVATLDLAIAVSSVKRPHACLRSHARAPHTITTGDRLPHPAASSARLQPRRSMFPRVSPRPVLRVCLGAPLRVSLHSHSRCLGMPKEGVHCAFPLIQ